jgi:hypothetical protein
MQEYAQEFAGIYYQPFEKEMHFACTRNKPYVYRRISDSIPLRMIWLALGGEQIPYLLHMAGFQETEPYVRKRVGRDVRLTLNRLFRTISHTPEDELSTLHLLIYCLTIWLNCPLPEA